MLMPPKYQEKGNGCFQGSLMIKSILESLVLTHKANIYTESRAAVAGGVTSFMEMPNTVPQALTQELLADKYAIGAQSSLANYSFLWEPAMKILKRY
jgi:dihydroorotase-like cyclic amidohydrolase